MSVVSCVCTINSKQTKIKMSRFLKLFIFSIFLLIITTATTTSLSEGSQQQQQNPSSLSNFIHNETANIEFLNLHNLARTHAHLPPYVWDLKLEQYARDYAAKRSADCSLTHSDGPYGENLFWGGGGEWTPKDAVKLWIKEHKYYDVKKNTCKPGKVCGHYTQIVWRDSTRLGCAFGQCKNGDTFGICSYDPPGNYIGELPFFHHEH